MTIKSNRWKAAFPNYWTLRCKTASTRTFFYEKNQAANYTSSSSQFFFSWKIFYFFKDLLRNNRKKKSASTVTFPFGNLSSINPITELFSTIKIVRKFLLMNLQCVFLKNRFQKLFKKIFFFVLSCTFFQKAHSAEFPQCWFHFSCLCVPGVLSRSKAIWWWLGHIKLRSSELGS